MKVLIYFNPEQGLAEWLRLRPHTVEFGHYLKDCHEYDLIFCPQPLDDKYKHRERTIIVTSEMRSWTYEDWDHYLEPRIPRTPTLSSIPNSIPKIAHFMWLSDRPDPAIPARYQSNLAQFGSHHPDWTIYHWTTPDLTTFITHNYPRYSWVLNQPKTVIARCDFIRWCLLDFFGGLYLDLDFYTTQSLNPLISSRDFLLARELPEHDKTGQQIYNGVIGSIAHHPFIQPWLAQMELNLRPYRDSFLNGQQVMELTGPIGLGYYYFALIKSDTNPPPLTDGTWLFPYTNQHKMSTACQPNVKEFLYTIWSEGSESEGQNPVDSHQSTSEWMVLAIILLLVIGLALFVDFDRLMEFFTTPMVVN